MGPTGCVRLTKIKIMCACEISGEKENAAYEWNKTTVLHKLSYRIILQNLSPFLSVQKKKNRRRMTLKRRDLLGFYFNKYFYYKTHSHVEKQKYLEWNFTFLPLSTTLIHIEVNQHGKSD